MRRLRGRARGGPGRVGRTEVARDLTSSLTSGRLRFAISELATLPRAAVVVEDRYSKLFAHTFVRPAVVADGLAELQVRWPTVPLVFCETRALAEEWTYRYLAAVYTWATDETDAVRRVHDVAEPAPRATAAGPSTAEIRARAVVDGFTVADRGRLRPEVVAAWQAAQTPTDPCSGRLSGRTPCGGALTWGRQGVRIRGTAGN